MHHQAKWFKSAVPAMLTLVLAACGTTNTDNGNGGTPGGPEPQHVFRTQHTLAAEDMGVSTHFYSYVLNGIEERSSRIVLHDNYEIDATRQLDIVFDAREIEAAFTPEAFFGWHLLANQGVSPEFTVSDPTARLKSVSNLTIFQQQGGWINSHSLSLRHDYTDRDFETWSSMRAVFANKAVTITGDYVSGPWDVSVDISLVPGWNLISYEDNYDDDSERWLRSYRARPAGSSTPVQTNRLTSIIAQGPIADPVYGITLFTREGIAEDPGTQLPIHTSYNSGNQEWHYVRALNWLDKAFTDSNTVPFAEVFGTTTGGNVLGAAGVQALLAGPLTFDRGTNVSDASASTGELGISSPAGHPAIFLYSDRPATVHLVDLITESSGVTLSTEDAGLQLWFGWNVLEFVTSPDDPTNVTVRAHTPNSFEATLTRLPR